MSLLAQSRMLSASLISAAGPVAVVFASLVFASLNGCTVRSLPDSEVEQSSNQCESSSACSGGRCVDGRCLAEAGEIERVLVEVVPPMLTTEVGRGGSVRYLKEQILPPKGTDFLSRAEREAFGLDLRPIATVTGSVDFSGLENDRCELSKLDAVALKVRFTPSEHFLGLSGATYTADVNWLAGEAAGLQNGELDTPVEFSISVPPGYYDVYLQPTLTFEEGLNPAKECFATPRLFRRWPIGVETDGEAEGEHVDEVRIPIALTPPSQLMVKINWPQNETSLEGWKVSMLDSNSGLVISTQEVLGGDSSALGGYEASLKYTSVSYRNQDSPEVPAETEVLRLSPPEGVVAPTLYASRVGLELFVPNNAEIELRELPKVVEVHGHVLLDKERMNCGEPDDDDGECAGPFTVQVVSSAGPNETSTFNDTIPKGMFASYQTTVETTDDLAFSVSLPAGEYRVIAIPGSDEQRPWAAGDELWLVGSEDPVVHGKTVKVSPRGLVVGSVNAPGSALTGDVQLTPSPRELVSADETKPWATTVLELTRRDRFAPQASPATLQADGSFEVFADVGVFDLTIRPNPESGFAWLVRPDIRVLPSDEPHTLGSMRLPLPVRYSGPVRALGSGLGSVGDALIRVYVYLDAEGKLTHSGDDATSVLQVGETRANSEGQFDLHLPSNLTQP